MNRKRPARDRSHGEQPQHDVLQMSQDCIDVAWEKSPERVIEFQQDDESELRLEDNVLPKAKKRLFLLMEKSGETFLEPGMKRCQVQFRWRMPSEAGRDALCST